MSRVGRETIAERLCDVLVAVVEHGEPITFAELQAATGLPRRRLYRYLAALRSCRLIAWGDGVGSPGGVLLELGSRL